MAKKEEKKEKLLYVPGRSDRKVQADSKLEDHDKQSY